MSMMPPSRALPSYAFLFAALYAAYGMQSAYLPAFLQSHGLPVTDIGVVLAAGTCVRIVVGPFLGWLADYRRSRRLILGIAAIASAVTGTFYLFAFGFLPLLGATAANAATTAALAPLSDALAVAASLGSSGFQYGIVRAIGSAAFVLGTLVSGQLVAPFGLSSIIVGGSILFLAMAFAVKRVDERSSAPKTVEDKSPATFRLLWRHSTYRCLLLFAALIIGSHAINDAFAFIAWRDAGLSNTAISLLWSESVAAEVAVFFYIGPLLLKRLGPAGAAGFAATAGILRWTVIGWTSSLPALIGMQSLHGLTFALLHLVAMQIIGRTIPDRLAGTAQSLYATALGIASATLTLGSGFLYGRLGLHAFWVMAALCAVGLPLTAGLRQSDRTDAPGGPSGRPTAPAPPESSQ